MSEWKECTIGECVSCNPETLKNNSNYKYINYLDTGNITKNKIEEFQYLVLGENDIPSRAKRIVKNGDIIYSTVRPIHEHYGYQSS